MTDTADPDMLAAELALGLLEGEARAVALRRVLAEPGFAAEVERWRTHFGLLYAEWPEASPSPDLFGRIEAAIAPPSPPVPANDREGGGGWGWKALAGSASLAAAVLAGVLVMRPAPTPERIVVRAPAGPILVAAIAPKTGAPIPAVYDSAAGGLRIAPAALADAGHSAELWVIAADKVPRSLGVLDVSGATKVSVQPRLRPQMVPGSSLVVTIEAPGGSSDGTPKGPAVASGVLNAI